MNEPKQVITVNNIYYIGIIQVYEITRKPAIKTTKTVKNDYSNQIVKWNVLQT